MTRQPQPDAAEMAAFRAIVDAAAGALDNLDTYLIREGEAHDLLVLHGLAMYARDTARAVLALLDAGHQLSAAALTRVVLEYATVAQWVGAVPGRGVEFMRQGEVDQHRWYKVIEEAGIELPESARGHRTAGMATRNVNGLDSPKTTFKAVDSSQQLYLQYRHLSKYVHPDVTTLSRYTATVPHGLALAPARQTGIDPESLLYFLAVGVLLASLPYLEILDETESLDRLVLLAAAHGVVADLETGSE